MTGQGFMGNVSYLFFGAGKELDGGRSNRSLIAADFNLCYPIHRHRHAFHSRDIGGVDVNGNNLQR
jgi:hypothetical protein